jgi:pimeloyl-ACP methyl ester carboxylesterase
MDIILVPGFWLDGSSWAAVTPALTEAGHRAYPLTLPGLESADASRAGIGLRDHVNAVVAAVDALDGDVVLVGHSGGGAIVHATVDERPSRVSRAIYVDSTPLAAGTAINDELPGGADEIPLPSWEVFDDADLIDLTDDLRARFRATAVPEPRGVAVDAQELHDERRYDVPVTMICCQFRSSDVPGWIEAGYPQASELGLIHEVDYVDLPTGHWPQFTRPTELGALILTAVDDAAGRARQGEGGGLPEPAGSPEAGL